MTSQTKMKGSEAIVRALQDEGCDVIFGYPGGVVIPFYDALMDSDLRHLLVRHEQGAAHAADGYARATGKVGVCIATSGPGATNLVTGIANAYLDSIPIVAITGQVKSDLDRHRRLPGGRHRPASPGRSPSTTTSSRTSTSCRGSSHEAFHIATTGRPGRC